MAHKIKPRRSYTANLVPLPEDLTTHEMAINWADNRLFVKLPDNTIKTIILGGTGSITNTSGGSASIVEASTSAGFPATGAIGTLYHATSVSRIYFWDTSGVYVEVGPK